MISSKSMGMMNRLVCMFRSMQSFNAAGLPRRAPRSLKSFASQGEAFESGSVGRVSHNNRIRLHSFSWKENRCKCRNA